jgi:mono/diheme cytochrome c family protein
MRLSLVALLLATTAPFSWKAGSPHTGVPLKARPAPTETSRSKGERVYLQRCAACHGKRGDGRGWAAATLPIEPRDFTAGVYKVRSTPTGTIPTDDDLFSTISRGMHGTPMMAWRGLPEDERWALVSRIKAFSPRFTQETAGPTVEVPPEPAADDALLHEGERLWQRLRCATCHGTGDGQGPSVALLQKDPGRRVRVRDLGRGEFLRGTSARDIYLTLRTGMDGTPMGSYAEGLTPRDTWALAAYVRSLVRAPADK